MRRLWGAASAGLAVLAMSVAGAEAQTPLSLTIGLSPADPVHLLQYIVQAKNFAPAEKLDAKWVALQSGTAAAMATQAGAIDVMESSVFEVIDAYIAGRDLKAFWNVSNFPAYQWYGQAKYQSVKDLKGIGRVGVSSIGSMTYILSQWTIGQSGLDPNADFKYIALGGPIERAAALQTGQVDLVPASPPSSFVLESQGYKPLLDLKDVAPQFEYEILYGRQKTLQDKAPAIRAFLRATLHAKAWAMTHQDEATDILMQNLGAKTEDRPFYAKSVALVLPYFPGDGTFATKSIDVFLDLYKSQKKITEIPPQSAFIDDQFIAYFKRNPVASTP